MRTGSAIGGLVLLALGVTAVGGCSLPLGPGSSVTVSGLGATLLAADGPVEGGINIALDDNTVGMLAAPTVADLCGLVLALGDQWLSNLAPGYESRYDPCWGVTKPPADSLFVATVVRVACTQQIVTVSVSGTRLSLASQSGGGNCPPGSGTQARSELSLIAVPLAHLPATIVSVESGFGSTIVDLHRPSQGLSALARFHEASLAIAEAEADAQLALEPGLWPGRFQRHPYKPSELALRTWADAQLSCSPGAPPGAISGYLVRFDGSSMIPAEYHVAEDHLTDCVAGSSQGSVISRPRARVDPAVIRYLPVFRDDSSRLQLAWSGDSPAPIEGTKEHLAVLRARAQSFLDDLNGLAVPPVFVDTNRNLVASLRSLVAVIDQLTNATTDQYRSLATQLWRVSNGGVRPGPVYQSVVDREAALSDGPPSSQ